MPPLEAPYRNLQAALQGVIPAQRLITDPLRTLAFGTDASFYRLIPKLVVRTETEAEVAKVLGHAARLNLAVTFRAAGTSLSGQALSDSVLVIAGSGWRGYEILDEGQRIRLQPGIIGGHANRYLAPYGRKIGPDPASINAAMVGGIVANNASGMCCGVAQNSYHTIDSVRLILADGTLVDTSKAQSRQAFADTHGHLLEQLQTLAETVRHNPALVERIRHKYKIKNTTGYSLNALVDFEDPFDILMHLMVGSEGTLGFVSEVVYRTVVEHPCKASALMIFESIHAACETTAALKPLPVDAVELMDRAALRSVADKPGMPETLQALPPEAAALLVETRSETPEALAANVAAVARAMGCSPKTTTESGHPEWQLDPPATLFPFRFTTDTDETQRLWNIRKGLFPSVGAMRRTGTTVIIEDVAFSMEYLADATLALQALLKSHGYDDAIIFGHAREGNLHFVFTQDFGQPAEVLRYRDFIQDICDMVVVRYGGSLKAEHGTGRNMAPFVELEWGQAAYALMQEIKTLFDPRGLLNPGVILNPDPDAHLQHLKPLPPAHALVDKCIECGFCEETCPSKNLTLTPRQRITVQREIARLKNSGRDPARLEALQRSYAYQGEQTCAADGLCALSCPVDINTGAHTKYLRGISAQGPVVQKLADLAVRHFGRVTGTVRLALMLVDGIHRVLGTRAMAGLTGAARRFSGNRLPFWTPWLPRAAPKLTQPATVSPDAPRVVYFPSCVSRTMGPAAADRKPESLFEVTQRVLAKAGLTVIHPPNVNHLCCGTPFESKGLQRQADTKAAELNRALLAASRNGLYPVLCDTSPCLERMRRSLDERLKLYEPVAFIGQYLLPRLDITKRSGTIALHVTCSARKMGLGDLFVQVARQCAANVVVPAQVDCCGFAGDRGFSHPELNKAALQQLRPAVSHVCREGFSNSRTCEIGLSHHSGISYQSILYLVDGCTK